MEENPQHFLCTVRYYFKKSKNTMEMQEKICAVYGEGAVSDRTYQKWFAKFLGTVDISVKQPFAAGPSMPWKVFSSPPASPHWKPVVGHSRLINKAIGENEKCVFYFMEKTKQTFLANPTH